MTAKAIRISAIILAATLLASCSPRISGNWTVQRYETTSPGEQGVVLTNIGTMQFNKSGSGEKNLNYSVFGVTYNDQIPFEWTWTDGRFVTIVSEGSEFSKTWIIIDNKKKFQKWKSTDGTNNIQIIELKK